MSMNQYMHPRNIYKQPPNFKQLAIDYPEFRQYAKFDISGKVSFDFKNVEALRALTCTLLKNDFNLELELPLNKLIPTVPLRLNYILWIEDLLDVAGIKDNVKGIDIGTGASCIYPLLGAKKNNWYFVATEIDKESIEIAKKNVEKNNLQHLIKIIEIKNSEMLLEELFENEQIETMDFCMCNPPFFGSSHELQPNFKGRRPDRPRPKNAFCASVDEVVVKGGEVDYITKLILESKNLKDKIKIFTTMIGHKSSLPILKRLLRDAGVLSFKQTEFCQGHTTRWGLAWTFLDIDLRKIPDGLLALKKHSKPLFYKIETDEKANTIIERLKKMFNDLQIEIELFKQSHNFAEFTIIAKSNTWSHQRRKRRELKRHEAEEREKEKNNNLNSSKSSEDSNDELHKKMSEITVEGGKKREWDENMEDYYCAPMKKQRVGYQIGEIYLKCRITLSKTDETILEFNYIEGSAGKEAIHQILQYVKNNLF